jgi:glutamine amidotransferase
MITIVDYGAGNLRSIERALVHLGEDTTITGDPLLIRKAGAIVFPGVGNAKAAMDQLNATGIAEAMTEAAGDGTPLLGICLGMQLLFGDQEEGPTVGLGLLGGRGVRLPAGLKAPHMGWNTVRFTDNGPFAGEPDATVYFVHSYIVEPDDPADIAGVTDYGVTFPSVVAHENIWGTQFHPEKSGDSGIALLGRWVAFARDVVAR